MSITRSLLAAALLLMVSSLANSQDQLTRNLGDFAGISVIGELRVELYKSDRPYVEIFRKNTAAENIITEVKDGVLSIRLKTNTTKDAEIKVKVFYTNLDFISAQAQCLILSPETITGKIMSFDLKSGAKISLDLDLSEIRADVKQGALMELTGKTERQEVNVNTGATYSAYELEARDSYIVALSGGKAKVTASRIIDANANAKGWIGYVGDPESVFVKTNLGGEIAKFKSSEESPE